MTELVQILCNNRTLQQWYKSNKQLLQIQIKELFNDSLSILPPIFSKYETNFKIVKVTLLSIYTNFSAIFNHIHNWVK
jgi:hypothetical protein